MKYKQREIGRENIKSFTEQKWVRSGPSLEVQWLRLHTSTAGGAGSISGWGTKIPYASQCGQKKKKKCKLEEAQGKIGTAENIVRSLPVCSVAQLCVTLCYHMDGSPPVVSVHGILQARIMEWIAISFSRGSSQWRRQWTDASCSGRQILLPLSHLGSPEDKK